MPPWIRSGTSSARASGRAVERARHIGDDHTGVPDGRTLESLAATLYVAGGFGFLLCAALLFLYMPSAIAVQIVHGGVGKQPGCPTFCRSVACCGAGHGRGASVQDMDMDGTMVVDMDGAPQKSSLRASSQRL